MDETPIEESEESATAAAAGLLDWQQNIYGGDIPGIAFAPQNETPEERTKRFKGEIFGRYNARLIFGGLPYG